MSDDFSTNPRAETLMGRRRTDGIPFDQPAELGYRCPKCLNPPLVDGEFDERLHWSEYHAFLWCEVCNIDWPSALCVPVDREPDPKRPWVHAGPEAAITVFLDTVSQAIEQLGYPAENG